MAEIDNKRLDEHRSLMRCMEWADALTWRSVIDTPSLHNDRPLLERLHHLHSTQWAYLQIWRGEPLQIAESASFVDLPALKARARDYYLQLSLFMAELREDLLTQTVDFPWAAQLTARFGVAAPTNLAESMLQVMLHTTYHWGQVAMRVREAGGEPPLCDFIAWLWLQRPAPQWEGDETA